ncbi:MAG TPA: A/G-specific adenine glycosylase [Vicinamibacteria bacterium]|nr:A/G-specific adenine glycosylase [Vicinamibacteria bacterium]
MPDSARRTGPRSHEGLTRDLLRWYRRSRRDLPWRRTSDPYAIWVSEVMLQQTTVRVVAPYYERFLSRFPDVASLAAASEEDVVGGWSGLGYYHRARNLRRAARHIVEHHGGRFPRMLEAALAVPGVGLYTASAVLSIAYGVPLPVVDGNVRRVLARLRLLRGPQWKKEGPFYNVADELLDRSAPGDWNQAVMELGATVCTPRKPACPACPLRGHCAARAAGLQEVVPEAKDRRATVDVTVAAAIIEEGGRILLVRRAEGRLMGRMWEVPQTSLESRGLDDLARELKERHALDFVPGPLVTTARHAITFRRIAVDAYRGRLRRKPPTDGDRYLWVDPARLDGIPLSSLTKKVIAGARSAQLPLSLGGA